MLKTALTVGLATFVSMSVYAQQEIDKEAIEREAQATANDIVQRRTALNAFRANCVAQYKMSLDAVQKLLSDAETKSVNTPQEATRRSTLRTTVKEMNTELQTLDKRDACAIVAGTVKYINEILGLNYLPGGFWLVGGAEINTPGLPLWILQGNIGGRGLIGGGVFFDNNMSPELSAVVMGGGHAAFRGRNGKVAMFEANGALVLALEPSKLGMTDQHNFRSTLAIDDVYMGISVESPFAKSLIKTSSLSPFRIMIPITGMTEADIEEKKALAAKGLWQKLFASIPKSKPVLVVFMAAYGGDDSGSFAIDTWYVKAGKIVFN